MAITKEEFRVFEGVRAGGVANMWDIAMVRNLSGLDMRTIIEIMRHYTELRKLYPDVRKEDR